MRWMVFNSKMDVIGVVIANDYNDAWYVANRKYRYVEYIQEM